MIFAITRDTKPALRLRRGMFSGRRFKRVRTHLRVSRVHELDISPEDIDAWVSRDEVGGDAAFLPSLKISSTDKRISSVDAHLEGTSTFAMESGSRCQQTATISQDAAHRQHARPARHFTGSFSRRRRHTNVHARSIWQPTGSTTGVLLPDL